MTLLYFFLPRKWIQHKIWKSNYIEETCDIRLNLLLCCYNFVGIWTLQLACLCTYVVFEQYAKNPTFHLVRLFYGDWAAQKLYLLKNHTVHDRVQKLNYASVVVLILFSVSRQILELHENCFAQSKHQKWLVEKTKCHFWL